MKTKNCSFESGFTLIELLVVIAIIGVLATLLLANLNATRTRARDAERKSDLKNIQTALRLYYNDNDQAFPFAGAGNQIKACSSGGNSNCTWGQAWTADDRTYMNTLPADPSDDRDYYYEYVDDDNYILSTCLENTSDDLCNPVNSHPQCAGSLNGCTYLVKP